MTDKTLETEEITIESDDVVNKYQMAAEVSNRMFYILIIYTMRQRFIRILLDKPPLLIAMDLSRGILNTERMYIILSE
jgi:hypothetical protein